MITKMKKLTFLVYHKEYDDFLRNIRDLGVIHVVEKQQGAESPELQESMRLSSRLHTALQQLQGISPKDKDSSAGETDGNGYRILEEVEALQEENAKLNQQLQALLKDENTLQPWGDFSPESIRKLHDAGMQIGFYIVPEKSFKEEWTDLYNAIIISSASSKAYFITITKRGDVPDVDAEHTKPPAHSLSEIRETIRATGQKIESNRKRLEDIALRDIPSLEATIKDLHGDIEFSRVQLSTEPTAGEKLMLLEGWVPVTREVELTDYLNRQNAYYQIASPEPGDNVPILLKNNGLFAWFEPICKLYMLPQYRELDLTPFFAPFFMVFFGLCLGDMGYGLFLLLLATGYRMFAKSIAPGMKPILSLVQVLAVSTIVCGLLTGGFFGFNLYDLDWPVVRRLQSAIALDNSEMFELSLILGVVQILFGMILKVANQAIQFGFKYSISTLGWVILLMSCIFASLFPSVLPMGGTPHLIILGISAVMIFLFNSPGKNIFLNIGLGVWDTYNMATGLLGDVLSYVRLFALGLSGGILASVFNSLASGLSPDNVIAGPIVFLLIFLIGHAINIFMNVLGAMVHPMRLTFVEFFKNAGYDGGGEEYKPFSK